MKVLTKEQLNDYQQNKACYDIFHTYHPINENEQLIYKKTNPSNVVKKVEQVTRPETRSSTSLQPSEQVTTSDVVATDRRPQNPQFRNRGHQITSVPKNVGPNITDNTYKTHQNTQTTPTEDTTNTATESNAVEDTAIEPSHTQHHQGNHFKAQLTVAPEEQEPTTFIPQKQPTKSQASQERVITTQNVRHANQFMPDSQSESQKPSWNQSVQPKKNNVIAKTVRNTNKIENEKDLNAELYNQIHKSATQLSWIQQVNSFELGYKKDLRDLPIPALRTFDLTDDEEMYLPLNEASTLHDINSFTITKDMCILLLFRNNAAIRLAPEEWFDNGKNRKLLIENGFEYFYKTVDANLLTETLKKISSSSASTVDMTQFIIKHMPFTPVE